MNRPEVVIEVSKPYRIESNRAYPPMEIRLALDFAFTESELEKLGPQGPTVLQYDAAVYAPSGTHDVELPFLRIVGFADWIERLQKVFPGATWQTNLWNMSGLYLRGTRSIRIGRLEVDGVPVGFRTAGAAGYSMDSAFLRRCAKPIDVRLDVVDGRSPGAFTLRNIATCDGRLDRGQDHGDRWRSRTSRTSADNLSGKSGGYITGLGYEVEGWVQSGDSFLGKFAGSRYRLSNLHGNHVYLNGRVPSHIMDYPGEAYQHLHEAREVVAEEMRLLGTSASFIDHVLLRVSYPFDPHVLIRKSTFVRGEGRNGRIAAQINWARVVFEDCHFVGWKNPTDAFELSPANGQDLPAAQFELRGNCRFWDS